MRPRLQSSACARPLSFTVRFRMRQAPAFLLTALVALGSNSAFSLADSNSVPVAIWLPVLDVIVCLILLSGRQGARKYVKKLTLVSEILKELSQPIQTTVTSKPNGIRG